MEPGHAPICVERHLMHPRRDHRRVVAFDAAARCVRRYKLVAAGPIPECDRRGSARSDLTPPLVRADTLCPAEIVAVDANPCGTIDDRFGVSELSNDLLRTIRKCVARDRH